jgi:hypothetical protein
MRTDSAHTVLPRSREQLVELEERLRVLLVQFILNLQASPVLACQKIL